MTTVDGEWNEYRREILRVLETLESGQAKLAEKIERLTVDLALTNRGMAEIPDIITTLRTLKSDIDAMRRDLIIIQETEKSIPGLSSRILTLEKAVTDLKTDIEVQKVKNSILGGVSGLAAAIIAIIAKLVIS